jgi:hypothetical protein
MKVRVVSMVDEITFLLEAHVTRRVYRVNKNGYSRIRQLTENIKCDNKLFNFLNYHYIPGDRIEIVAKNHFGPAEAAKYLLEGW